MKKIGIITIHKSPNYGASLQAFALWKFLENEGYDVEIIDLYRSFFKGYIPSKRFFRKKRMPSFEKKVGTAWASGQKIIFVRTKYHYKFLKTVLILMD